MKIKSFKEFINEGKELQAVINFKVNPIFWDFMEHDIIKDISNLRVNKKYFNPKMWIDNWGSDHDGIYTLLTILIDIYLPNEDSDDFYRKITNEGSGLSMNVSKGQVVIQPHFDMGEEEIGYGVGSIKEWKALLNKFEKAANNFKSDEVFNIGDSKGYEGEYLKFRGESEPRVQIDRVDIAIDSIIVKE